VSWVVVRGHDAASARVAASGQPASRPYRPGGVPSGLPVLHLLTRASPLGACETRIGPAASRAPAVAIVGASYTAGVGPDNPKLSWAVRVAQRMRWNAVIYGVSGAGYVRSAHDGGGPMIELLQREDLRRLDPALVIVQAGYDDAGVPAAVERRQVSATVDFIQDTVPAARIALLTTFTTPSGATAALRATNQAIISGGVATDPGIIVMNPLAGRWRYAHVDGRGLHPTEAGDQWIAGKVAAILTARGLPAATAGGRPPVICDLAVG
jgi:acyl-CoA thioesterase-1